jgi:photosystem II stability/assembly factor-like uncharacterized protein
MRGVATPRVRLTVALMLVLAGAACASRQSSHAICSGNLNSSQPTGFISRLAIDPHQDHVLYLAVTQPVSPHKTLRGSVWVSATQGTTWTRCGWFPYPIHGLAAAGTHPTTLFAGTRWGHIYRSVGGDRWGRGPGSGEEQHIDAFAVDPRAATTVWAVGTPGVQETTNGGETWRSKGFPEDFRGSAAIALDPSNPTTLYVGGGGLAETTDGGSRWQRIGGLGEEAGGISSLAVAPNGTLWVATEGPLGGGWILTRNGPNQSFSRVLKFHGNTFGTAIAVDPQDPSVVEVGTTHSGLYQTSDSGQHWVHLSHSQGPPPDSSIRTIEFDRIRPDILVVATNRALFQESGKKWHSI